MAVYPSIQCACGQRLTATDAVSRVFVSENLGWERYYVRFRCPRCRRPSERHFEIRNDDELIRDGEVYEQIAPSSFGPISREEQETARLLLDLPVEKIA